MNIDFTARHYEVDDSIKDYAVKRLEKMTRFMEEPVGAQMVLETEHYRQIAELHVSHRFGSLKATEVAEDMQAAVHAVLDKAEKQARRSRKKFMDKRRRARRDSHEHHWPLEIIEAESLRSTDETKVVKTTRLPIRSMSLEEAALELEASKNDFYVFLDSAHDRVSVLYRRKDNNLGLIAPEF